MTSGGWFECGWVYKYRLSYFSIRFVVIIFYLIAIVRSMKSSFKKRPRKVHSSPYHYWMVSWRTTVLIHRVPRNISSIESVHNLWIVFTEVSYLQTFQKLILQRHRRKLWHMLVQMVFPYLHFWSVASSYRQNRKCCFSLSSKGPWS